MVRTLPSRELPSSQIECLPASRAAPSTSTVALNADVFCAGVKLRVLCQGDGSLGITVDHRSAGFISVG